MDARRTDAAASREILTLSETARPDKSHVKYFVLDTNVLLHNPNALFMFDDNEVVVPFTVLEELDKFKKQNDDVGRNARQVIRHLDRLRAAGPLSEGVTWNGHGGQVRVIFSAQDRPRWIVEDSPDNRIIAVALELQNQKKRTILISKDVNVRIKADALGLRVEDFEAEKVDPEHLYQGFVSLTVPAELIDALYQEKYLEVSRLEPHLVRTDERGQEQLIPLVANQYVQLRSVADDSHTGLARRLGDTDNLIPIQGPRKPVFGIMARNVQQTMALDLLLDDEVKLVTLLGSAGTGKTLL
ncbi:MAG: PhoH family protein, partial [Phycisphaeraceae bacterium]|nr:PhoH family protein [Phycisphaeraceae bacterium]